MTNLARLGRIGFTATAILLIGTIAVEAQPNNGGYSSDPIFCHNQVVNDYYDQIAQCEKNLSDLPADLAQCKQDAADDYNRRDAACKAKSAARLGGDLLDGGGLTVSPGGGSKPPKKILGQSLGKNQIFVN